MFMVDVQTLAEMNGAYRLPPDAGPAWRAAYESGIDMSLIEENLMRSPWERLLANDRALALIEALQQAKNIGHGTAH